MSQFLSVADDVVRCLRCGATRALPGVSNPEAAGWRWPQAQRTEARADGSEVLVLPPFARALADFAERHQGCQ